MHTASKSLKKAHQDLDVDKIADLMDDIQEQQDVSTVDSAFNELGYNEIPEFLNIHFFKTDFSEQRYYYEGGQD